MIRLFTRTSFVALVALLAACADSPLSPAAGPTGPSLPGPIVTGDTVGASVVAANAGAAQRYVDEELYHLDGLVMSCTAGDFSDTVHLEGDIFERYVTLLPPSGGVLLTRHAMPVGVRGFSGISGEEYRVRISAHGVAHESPELEQGGWRERITLVGRESMRTFTIEFRVRFLFNERSERLIVRDEFSSNCHD